MDSRHRLSRRVTAALLAGGVAIGLNTLALKAADLVPLATARGGLLRLITPWFAGPLARLGVAELWVSLGLPATTTPLFQTGFHLVVGVVMALVYAFILEPMPPRGAWRKGWIYAGVVWILNAAIVLPATGEGFAGSAHLSLAGMIWFAAAHTLFFVLLAIGYERILRASIGAVRA